MSQSKTLGSIFIIAGSTIGAGMLALPIAFAGLGFMTATFLLVITWIVMTYTALLMLEVHQHAHIEATFNSLAKNLLGKKGQVIANFTMMYLYYALCAAYIAGGGSQLQDKLIQLSNMSLPAHTGSILFTLIVGAIITLGTSTLDKINRVLFTVKIITLLSIFYMFTPYVEAQHLLEMPIEKGLILAAIPLVFTSFGFHGTIPSIVKYVGIDIKSLRKIMLVGAALPLLVYLLWQLVTLGVMSQADLIKNHGLSDFISSLASILHNPKINNVITIFANLALATSFLGVSLGLFDFLSDTLKQGKSKKERYITTLVTFIPPFCFAVFYPQGFIMALGYAAIGIIVLAVFLPVAMVCVQRKQRETLNNEYRVKGGNKGLVCVVLFGILSISAQCLQMLDILPAIGH